MPRELTGGQEGEAGGEGGGKGGEGGGRGGKGGEGRVIAIWVTLQHRARLRT